MINNLKKLRNNKKVQPAKPVGKTEKAGNNEGDTRKVSILGKFLKARNSISFRLISAFMVPVAFIIILGVVSYNVASNGIVERYEDSSLQTITMTGEYLKFGLVTIESTSLQYSNDNSISNYFNNDYADNRAEFQNAFTSIERTISIKKAADDFFGNIYLISDKVKSITTNKLEIQSGVLNSLSTAEDGIDLSYIRMRGLWLGENRILDEYLETTPNDYAIRFIIHMSKAPGLIVVDVNKQKVNDILATVDYDESGILAFVTPDGKEIISGKDSSDNSDEKIFYGAEFYQSALEAEAKSGAEYVNYKGKSHLFTYAKLGNTGAMVCSLMPNSYITRQARNIGLGTTVISIIAIAAATFTAIVISRGIGKVFNDIITKLKAAAKGDLTVTFETKRKDEFSILVNEIQNTFSNMKELIRHVTAMSADVSESAEHVAKTSELFLKSTKEISSSMNEIEQGVNQQANDAQECLSQMENLSQKIVLVRDNTRDISLVADQAKNSIDEGTKVTENLNKQTESTIEITTDIIKEIELLEEKSISISKIVNVINEIANQTNLLSLNASIEAARAGEYGRGFAVVAGEIRKLAEQSQAAVNDIMLTIRSIQEVTKTTVETAKKVEKELMLQGDAVRATTSSFTDINGSVERLMKYLDDITLNVHDIEEARVSTLGAIENISAVLEEVAASTNTVSQTSDDLISSVETLNSAAETLNQNAELLVDRVNKFKI
ncbi:MAG: methyl-accepting chemotaxis protein [Clostridiales bacterium]|nr:methyl-accepting chemotaxis protein [Clostridiales bacterium]